MRGGQDSIKRYLEERGIPLVPADPKAVAIYQRSMEKLIPKIEREMREQAILAAEFRRTILF